MAALALLARIGDASEVGVLGNGVHIDFRHLFHRCDELIGMRLSIGYHVFPIGIGAHDRIRPVESALMMAVVRGRAELVFHVLLAQLHTAP